ncbi:MAG: hypothetical protein M3460_03920 [Actinomycetota bacterium]|nr:hypothetical protein [Actinomycetota bacterium]
MSASVGFYFFDLNDFYNTSCYWDQAREAAQDAGNTELNIYVLGQMSHAAYWQGKAHMAIDTAAAAQSLVSKPMIHSCESMSRTRPPRPM